MSTREGVLGSPLVHDVGDQVEIMLDDEQLAAEVIRAEWENYGTSERYDVRIASGSREGEIHTVGDSCEFV